MLILSSEEVTTIYEKFQNIDRYIQFKIEHPDNTGSLSLLDFKMQISPGYPRDVKKAMDCEIVVNEFVLQSRYYVHFRANTLGKGIKTLYLLSYGLNSTATVFQEWLWH